MGRPSKRDEVLAAVKKDLLRAEVARPDIMPINFAAVARRTGYDRRTIRAYAKEEILAARKAQERDSLSAARQEEEAYRNQLRRKDAEIKLWRERYHALLLKLTNVEYNAVRLGIDPEELYVDMPPTDRTVPRTGHRQRD